LVATVFLPKRLRQPFYDLYAYCRTADDIADQSGSRQEALDGLAEYAKQIDDVYAGRPVSGIFVALAQTVRDFDLPRRSLEDLLVAFRQDQTVTRYGTVEELLDYCRYSANPVGRLVLKLSGCLNDRTAELSDQICTGLQLANFWQDVARDRDIGRVYLPADVMRLHGVTEAMLGEAITPQPLRRLLAAECDRAEAFFRRGLPLAEEVPAWLAKDIRLFAHGGLATLAAIRRIDFDVLRKRPKVTKLAQMRLMLRACLGRLN